METPLMEQWTHIDPTPIERVKMLRCIRPLDGSIAESVKVLTGRDNAMSGIAPHEIGIVHYPGAQVACILGLTDLFGVASKIALDQRRSGQSPLRVTHWQSLHTRDA